MVSKVCTIEPFVCPEVDVNRLSHDPFQALQKRLAKGEKPPKLPRGTNPISGKHIAILKIFFLYDFYPVVIGFSKDSPQEFHLKGGVCVFSILEAKPPEPVQSKLSPKKSGVNTALS